MGDEEKKRHTDRICEKGQDDSLKIGSGAKINMIAEVRLIKNQPETWEFKYIY